MKGRRVMGMKRWKLTLQVAATYVGTVVGAGFATGKEIVQFLHSTGNLEWLEFWSAACFYLARFENDAAFARNWGFFLSAA